MNEQSNESERLRLSDEELSIVTQALDLLVGKQAAAAGKTPADYVRDVLGTNAGYFEADWQAQLSLFELALTHDEAPVRFNAEAQRCSNNCAAACKKSCVTSCKSDCKKTCLSTCHGTCENTGKFW